jgi:circadian clock protein KaiB
MATPSVKVGLRLRLYVAGNGPNSLRAISNARAICGEHFVDDHELEIVDMLLFPKRAFADGIIVTPTLLKVWPLPVSKVIGDLGDATKVLLSLGRA